MHVLLIDDDDVILDFLQICLEDNLPEVQVTAYQSERLGPPRPDFDWAKYDLLLLDYNLGHGENGVEWLDRFGAMEGFPRTILITATSDPAVVAAAVKSGADGYLNKVDLTPGRLLITVKDVMESPLASEENDEATAKIIARPGRNSAEVAARIAQASAEPEDPVGANYRFRRMIGEGAMSRVYLAERSGDGMTVVVKILDRSLARDPEYLQRFRVEGALVEGMHSPHVVKILDRGLTNSYDYIVMEFFGKGDLKQRIDHGMAPGDALACLQDIALGLRAIHRANIVHRDLKPANIMFRSDNSLALADFGVAKRLDTDLSLTATGSIVGTLAYMSPEQAAGDRADPRFDIYSAGVVFYEMLMGQRPYLERSVSAMLFQHMHGPVPDLPAAFARYQPLLNRLMCKQIEGRFQNADELLESIAALHVAA